MARNSVAPNLLMLVLVIGGLYMATKVKQEYLPSTEPDTVMISVALPGATPAEVEQSIVLALENAVSGIDGIDKMSATAAEGSATLTLELSTDRRREVIYDEIQQEVDRVTTLPEDAEEPVVQLSARRRAVMDVQVYGATTDHALRMATGRYSDTPGNRTDPIYWGGSTVDEYMTKWPAIRPPGTVFRYANNDTLLAARAIRTYLDFYTLPTLLELRGQLVGLLQAPAGKLARLLKEPGGQLARVMGARRDALSE